MIAALALISIFHSSPVLFVSFHNTNDSTEETLCYMYKTKCDGDNQFLRERFIDFTFGKVDLFRRFFSPSVLTLISLAS